MYQGAYQIVLVIVYGAFSCSVSLPASERTLLENEFVVDFTSYGVRVL